jgi:hypothetical protein
MMFRDMVRCVGGACCAAVMMVCGGDISAMVSGVEYHNSQLGYYLINKRLNLDEMFPEADNTLELPSTNVKLEEFLTDKDMLWKCFGKLSTELVFGCIEQKGLDNLFLRLRGFAHLLATSNCQEARLYAIDKLFFCLCDQFQQLTNQIERHGLLKESFSLARVATELNVLHEILCPDDNCFYSDVFPNEFRKEK